MQESLISISYIYFEIKTAFSTRGHSGHVSKRRPHGRQISLRFLISNFSLTITKIAKWYSTFRLSLIRSACTRNYPLFLDYLRVQVERAKLSRKILYHFAIFAIFVFTRFYTSYGVSQVYCLSSEGICNNSCHVRSDAEYSHNRSLRRDDSN